MAQINLILDLKNKLQSKLKQANTQLGEWRQKHQQKLNDLSYKYYKLDDHPNATQSLQLSNKTPEHIAADFNTKKDKKGNLAYTDYHQRQLILTHDNFTQHITEKKYIKQQRHLLYEKIREILTTPDEVYINLHEKTNGLQYRYLKFYQNSKPLVVVGEIKSLDEPLEIKSWFVEYKDLYRKGILIKK